MQRTPDFELLAEKFERGRRTSSSPMLLLGRTCGRLAGTPDMVELARQALALLEPDGRAAQVVPRVDHSRLKEWHRAFQSAFPTSGALQEMVSYAYGLRPPETKWAGPALSRSIETLFDWASSTGQLEALVSAAVAYNPGNPALRAIASSREHQPGPDSQQVLDHFASRFKELSSLERYGLLQTIYRRIPVPAFYQDLARIIKARFVRQILTTNIDSLLEQALEALGLARDVDFDVIVLGTSSSRDALNALESDHSAGADRLLIIKLHGDISQGEFGVSPDELSQAVRAAQRFIKNQLDCDLVMLGYEGESAPLNDWLAKAPNEFWWVGIEPPHAVLASARVHWLETSLADFLAALAPRLLTLRATGSASGSGLPGGVSFGAIATGPSVPPSPPSERDLLRQEIDRLKAEVASIGLGTGSTATAVQRQEQTAERLRRIRELEDQLRALPDVRTEILELVERLERSLADVGDAGVVDNATRGYLQSQLATLRTEHKAAQPNAHIVSAALGAALVITERLGPTVVNPQDVRALAAVGPSTVVRV